MRLQKAFLIIFILLTIAYVNVEPSSSQIKEDEIISFPGIIESVGESFKFIVVNEARIRISSSTNVVDENGNMLRIIDLKPKLPVTVEAVRNLEGLSAKKIIIKTMRKKP